MGIQNRIGRHETDRGFDRGRNDHFDHSRFDSGTSIFLAAQEERLRKVQRNLQVLSNNEALLNVSAVALSFAQVDQETNWEQGESENCAKQVEVMAGAVLQAPLDRRK